MQLPNRSRRLEPPWRDIPPGGLCEARGEGLLRKDFQSLIEVGDQVVGVLDTHGQTEHTGSDAHLSSVLVGHVAVGGGNGVVEVGVDAAQGGGIVHQVQPLHELVDLLHVLGDDEAHHAGHGVIGGKQLRGQLVLGEALQAGMVHFGNIGVGLQGTGQLGGGGHLLAYAQIHSLQVVGHGPGGEGIAGSTAEHAHGMDGVDDLGGGSDGAGDGVAVAVHELGHGVDDDVGTLVQRTDGDGGSEGVVDHHIGAVGMGDLGQGGDVGNVQGGVGQHLGIDEFGVGFDGLLHILNVVKAHQVALNAELGHELGHHVEGLTVDVAVADDVVAGLEDGHQRGGDGAHAGGEDQGLLAVFQIGDHLGQRLAVGVVGTHIGELGLIGLPHLRQRAHGEGRVGKQGERGGLVVVLALGSLALVEDFGSNGIVHVIHGKDLLNNCVLLLCFICLLP